MVVRSIFSFSRKQRPLILKQTDRGSLAIEAPSSGKKREVGAQIILLHHTACAVSRRDILAIHVTDRGVILYPPSSINIITCNTLVNTAVLCTRRKPAATSNRAAKRTPFIEKGKRTRKRILHNTKSGVVYGKNNMKMLAH